jgi:hypothetical protein
MLRSTKLESSTTFSRSLGRPTWYSTLIPFSLRLKFSFIATALAYNPSAGIPIPRVRNSPTYEASEENKDVNGRISETIMPTRELNSAKFGEV